MDYVITADSTCDLSREILDKYSIRLVPLTVNIGDDSFKDGIDVSPKQLFSYFEETGELAKTSAISIGEYCDFFSSIINEGKKVLHINISSHFSSSYQNARLAAEEFEERNIFVVDSLNLSTGSGHVVLRAAEMAASGISLDEVAERLVKDVIPKVEASFVIDDLTYLHCGGRCSSVAKLGANFLKLKPCIEVTDGKMHVGKKYRGEYKKCVLEYVKNRLRDRDDLDLSRIFITYTSCSPELLKEVRGAIEKETLFDEILETTAGCTISAHCGPNTLGILFLRK